MSHTRVLFDTARLLAVLPNVGAASDGDLVFLDIKAAEGLKMYSEFWPGPVRGIFRSVAHETIGYGRWFKKVDLPFDVTVLGADATCEEIAKHADGAALLLAGADDYLDLGLVDALPDTPVVMTIEYTFRTRLAIIWLERSSPLRMMKTMLWLCSVERKRRRALRIAAGLQANGAPAFESYHRQNSQPMLYFDTRLRQRDYLGAEGAVIKAQAVMQRVPLRLVFSGRLELIKGVEDLLAVMIELRASGLTQATLDVFGAGSRRDAMQSEIERAGLADMVRINDPVDFETTLVPMLKQDFDIFLCCHPQGDPSCTYLETLGCGVPIVGYANTAFEGVLQLGNCGVRVPMGKTREMARAIERLDRDRATLAALIIGATDVASNHLLETVFEQRVRHLQQVMLAWP